MKNVKIMLDAGHYGKYNRSPANTAYYESDFAFKFVNLLKAALEGYGFTVGKTREDQAKDLALITRGKAAAGYNFLISVHSNAVGSGINDSVDYPAAIVMVDDAKVSIDEESKAVGNILAQAVAKAMGTTQAAKIITKQSDVDRDGNGIKDDEYYGVLHGAKMVGVPAIILEHSFHTNTKATNWLLNDSNLQAMAAAEAAALAEYYGMTAQTTPKQENQKQESQEAATPWYRVRKSWADASSQIGAYEVKDNAIKGCPEGYTVYDDNGTAIYTNAKKATTTASSTAASTTTAAASKAPTYKVGNTYTLQVELKVRTGAGTNNPAKKYSQLTADGKKHDKDGDGALDKGTVITCKEVKTVGTDIWIRCPSGWLAAYYQGNIYIK